MLSALAALALLTAHILPGLLVVRLLGLGRSPFERWVMAAVLGGPLAAVVYLVSLTTGSSSLYWVFLVALDVSALIVTFRTHPSLRESVSLSRNVRVGLIVLVGTVVTAYMLTTGTLFRLDGEGNLLMDRALQRDTLFHIGMVRSLLASYPPELLSSSGVTVTYHAGYHLQVAAWARFFGIDVLDGVYRVGAVWALGLLILSAFLLGRRFTQSDAGGLMVAVMIFGAGLGFLFPTAPGADWWSLLFIDVALVSVFLPNPLLPALPLLFVGLALLDDYLQGGDKGALIGSALGLIPLLFIKVFLGVQILSGLASAALLMRAKRLRLAAVFLCLVSLLTVVPMLVAGSGNTAVGVRPLEIVRYSMEKLGWVESEHALTDVANNAGAAIVATLIWAVGFMGLRLVGVRALFGDVLRPGVNVRAPMAFATLIGLFVALVFRVAPPEATGLSRLEAFNDVVWFAAQSGILLWFWTAAAVLSFARGSVPRAFVAASAVLVVALPCTIQHFVYKVALGADRVALELVETAEKVEELSLQGDAWVEPLNRVRPSLVAYLAGRPVVHDSYVGYDYMFIPREEVQYRRHAVAQFWRTNDPAYASWFLDHYAVRGVLARTDAPLPGASEDRVDLVFSNRAAQLYEVDEANSGSVLITIPARLPIGLRGAHYFGEGWSRPAGSPRTRKLFPGKAELYIPIRANVPLTLEIELETPHGEGGLDVGRGAVELAPEQETVRLTWPETSEAGLQRFEIEWSGPRPLVVSRIDTVLGQNEK